MTGPITFPFAALVGMDDMREALLLNAVDPRIGGVLIRGEKGTAKSTAVRALPYALPAVSVVRGCRFRCDPAKPNPDCPDGPHIREQAGEDAPTRLVEMPVGATEDRVVGSLDLEKALTTGVKSFEPGLLAAAHRGILYLDEVNLLNDHLVDVLLDASALGVNYVERDGVSVRHPATFLLVGTMNPEEGELRPQLLDRFGLTVDAAAPRDPQLRVEIVRRRLMFDADPASFAEQFADAEKALVAHIVTARNLLTKVTVTDAALQQIASVCAAFDVDGLRADIVTARTAAAYAAWHGRDSVTTDDIRAAARLTLPHRRRRNPFDAPGLDEQRLKEALADPEDDPDPDPGPSTAPEDNESVHTDPSASDAHSGSEGSGTTQTDAAPGEQSGSTDQTAAMPAGTFRPNRIEVPGLGEGNV
ncbi:MAG: ATP-binding protein, partial [Gordonia polyisoprenivorans]|nr:ATP-binding protein [Gordonia polyisoprenivorans]